ncbi:MAG: type II toxin-antitoxin system RelE/ParE family toxin [Elusimicrobia bacterium]|nr:type II toxin-antitoxin system RelE/ParE family toxin [Elusimicrobiota bacterium]
MRVVLLAQAQEDLDEISEPLFSEVVKRLETLKDFPELGAPMAGPFAGWRSTVAGLFRVVYRLTPRGVIEVAYVRDCRRSPLQ